MPPDPVSTEVARGLLPAQVPHADAAANAGRAALLVAALAGRPELLHRATRDLLHQDYREPAMPASLALVAELRARRPRRGGLRCRADGAGLHRRSGAAGRRLVDRPRDLLARCPEGWSAQHLEVDHRGVLVSG